MTDPWIERLSEYRDGELTDTERSALDAHLAQCETCRGVLDELTRVVARAQSLPDRPPAQDLWPRIAQRIAAPAARPQRWRRIAFSVPQLLAASIVVALLAARVLWLTVAPAERGAPAAAAAPATLTARVAWAGDAQHDAAIAELQAALDAGQRAGRLDSSTVRIVEHNLAVIDTAIVQARRALAADPGSTYLNHHLADTMCRKRDLLRVATMAIASART